MSLINDALKRANNATNEPPGGTPPTVGLKAADSDSSGGLDMTKVIGAAVVLALLVGAGWFIWKAVKKPKPQPVAAAKAAAGKTNAAPTAAKPPAVKTNAGAPPYTPGTSAKADPKAKPQPGKPVKPGPGAPAKPAPEPPTKTAAAAAAPAWPDLKLQGIFYRLQNPTARLNGQNVSANQVIDGAKVVAIERDSVTLEFNGETKTLSMK